MLKIGNRRNGRDAVRRWYAIGYAIKATGTRSSRQRLGTGGKQKNISWASFRLSFAESIDGGRRARVSALGRKQMEMRDILYTFVIRIIQKRVVIVRDRVTA